MLFYCKLKNKNQINSNDKLLFSHLLIILSTIVMLLKLPTNINKYHLKLMQDISSRYSNSCRIIWHIMNYNCVCTNLTVFTYFYITYDFSSSTNYSIIFYLQSSSIFPLCNSNLLANNYIFGNFCITRNNNSI